MLKGIDVSKWQGSIDWAKVKSQVDFVILRAGYGKLTSQKDERFEEYYAACEKYGIPKGVYWFSYAVSGAEAVQEANAFLSCVKGKKFEYPVWFDYECPPGYPAQKQPSVARAVITNWIDTVSKAGYYVGLYSYYSLFKDVIPSDLQTGKYDIWLAHYASSTPYKGHKIWQYSEKGKVNGCTGTIDMNYCYIENYPEIIQKAELNGLSNTTVKQVVTPVVENNKTYPIDSNTTTYEQKHYAYNDKTQLSKHFNVQEFKCKCGKQHDIVINTRLVAGLEKLFETFDCSMIIVNSGYRCPKYDIKVGGFAGKHSVGDAADVVFYDKNKSVISTKKISCAAQDLPVYFGGIANINKTYTAIHLDVRKGYRWLGNEIVSNHTVTDDFYKYYGLTKQEEVVLPNPPAPTTTTDDKKECGCGPDCDCCKKELTAGSEIQLSNIPIYASSTTTKNSSKRTGTYYIYKDEVINGRIRVTNKKENVGKTPAGTYVSGWVNASDIQ